MDIPSPASSPNRTATQPESTACAGSPNFGLVVPAFREAENIRALLERIRGSLDPLRIPYEVIVVDDDSRDGTEEIVREFAASDPRFRFACRTGERGLGGAVRFGWTLACAEVLGVIDADLQHPPELLPALWARLQSGKDLALASRYVARSHVSDWHPLRQMLSRGAIALTARLQKKDIRVEDPISGFFLLRRECLRNVELQTNGFKLLLEILVRANVNSVVEVPFNFAPRRAGLSKASWREGVDYLRLLARLFAERRSRQLSAVRHR